MPRPFITLLLLTLLQMLPNWAFAADFSTSADCPICKIKYATLAGEEAGGEKACDGKPIGGRFLPPPECPLCGGVFANETFTNSELRKIEEYVWSAEYQKQRGIDAWLRQALLLEKIAGNHLKIAEIYLKASWANDHIPLKKEQYQQKSLEQLRNYLTANDFDPGDTFTVRLKIGDLLRQLGKFSEAQQWFAQMLIKPEFNDDWQQIVIKKELHLIAKADKQSAALPQGNALHDAITSDNPDNFKQATLDLTLLNERNLAGLSPLLLAIKEQKPEYISILLKAGADIKLPDRNGNSPLHWAIKVANRDLMTWLLDKNININAANNQKKTPLMLAVETSTAATVKKLLDCGADTDSRDASGNSILHLLAKRLDTEAIKIYAVIKKRTADFNQRNFADFTPLHLAALAGNKEILTELISAGANIDARLPDGQTALFFCQPNLIPFLLKLGARSELKNNTGNNAFIKARLNGNPERIRFFKKTDGYGEKAVQFNVGSETIAIFTAIEQEKIAVVRQILQIDANQVNAKDIRLGESPLHLAVASRNAEMVSLLLTSGAKVNCESDFLRTPLHYAAVAGKIAIVKMLCAAGANIFALDARGSTPLHDSASAQNRRIYDYLLSLGASDSTADNSGQPAATILEND